MYFTFLLLLVCSFLLLPRRQCRLTTSNWLSSAYGIYNKRVYPFHKSISLQEQAYISAITSNYDPDKEFDLELQSTGSISPYSFSISIDKESNKVNLTRFNIGSVEKDIRTDVKRLLESIKLDDSFCKSGYKCAGVGWDLIEGILKFYTLSDDKCKIECHVYKVQRDDRNEITEAVFDMKKTYDVGEKNTRMYKNGEMVNQINIARPNVIDTHNPTANDIIKKMRRMGFILDTYSEYDGTVTLYFD